MTKQVAAANSRASSRQRRSWSGSCFARAVRCNALCDVGSRELGIAVCSGDQREERFAERALLLRDAAPRRGGREDRFRRRKLAFPPEAEDLGDHDDVVFLMLLALRPRDQQRPRVGMGRFVEHLRGDVEPCRERGAAQRTVSGALGVVEHAREVCGGELAVLIPVLRDRSGDGVARGGGPVRGLGLQLARCPPAPARALRRSHRGNMPPARTGRELGPSSRRARRRVRTRSTRVPTFGLPPHRRAPRARWRRSPTSRPRVSPARCASHGVPSRGSRSLRWKPRIARADR